MPALLEPDKPSSPRHTPHSLAEGEEEEVKDAFFVGVKSAPFESHSTRVEQDDHA